MMRVQLNHHDGSTSETNVPLNAKLLDLSLIFCVDSVEVIEVLHL
jgi:hypothetical protein